MQNGILHLCQSKRHQANPSLYTTDELLLLDMTNCSHNQAVIQMDSSFDKEFELQQLNPDKYFNAELRAQHEISFDKYGLLKEASGKVFEGIFIFVELADHRLIAAPANEVGHHSYLSAGLPVVNAGYFFCSSGILITVSNNSGHYKPHRDKISHNLKRISDAAKNPLLIFEDHSDMSQETIEENKVRYTKAKSFLDERSPRWLNKSDLGNLVQSSIALSLKRILDSKSRNKQIQEDELAEKTANLSLGALDPDACSKSTYTFAETIPEEEKQRMEKQYQNSLVDCYTMSARHSRYGRSSSLSKVIPN